MDPIANMLIMIKNASTAGREVVSFPYSNFKETILECVKRNGFITSFSKKTRNKFPVLEVKLTYNEDKSPKVKEVERISKSSKRVYFKMGDIHPVKSGYGLLVLSTPKGILSGKEARKEQVGGEALFKMW